MWEDPDQHQLVYMTNGKGKIGCCDDSCPQRESVGDIDRTHDAEQHFMLYLELNKQLKREEWVEDIWLNYSPCAACADTITKYYKEHDNVYKGWRPKINVARIYQQYPYQQQHRNGLKKMFHAGFHLEALDPKKFLRKYKEKLNNNMQDVLKGKKVHIKTKFCLHAVDNNCNHPGCEIFHSSGLPNCQHLEL